MSNEDSLIHYLYCFCYASQNLCINFGLNEPSSKLMSRRYSFSLDCLIIGFYFFEENQLCNEANHFMVSPFHLLWWWFVMWWYICRVRIESLSFAILLTMCLTRNKYEHFPIILCSPNSVLIRFLFVQGRWKSVKIHKT